MVDFLVLRMCLYCYFYVYLINIMVKVIVLFNCLCYIEFILIN